MVCIRRRRVDFDAWGESMSRECARVIAVIGAGCSGAMTLVHLLENLPDEPVRILLIDPEPTLGRGVAYARRHYPYLVNAPAATMSIRSQDPLDFVRFLQEADATASVADFPTREQFGDYVEARASRAIEFARSRSSVDRIYQAAIRLDRWPDQDGWKITLANGEFHHADTVVLALGNPAPTPLSHLATGTTCDGISDPWNVDHLAPDARSILVVGTGLTMVDAVCALLAASPDRQIHALSRHGLMPLNQTDTRPAGLDDGRLAEVLKDCISLRRLVREVIRAGRRMNLAGGDWRRVIISVRQQASSIWGRFSVDDRRRFLRHVRPYWDIHRHRFPAPVWSTVQTLLASGQLTLHAGRLECIERAEGRFQARWRTRVSGETTEVTVDRVFNCTGPDYHIARSKSPLWRHLLRESLISPDALHLGLQTGALGEVLNPEGAAVPNLYYVGPLRRAQCWEATAVAELRVHAEALARHLARPDVGRQ